MKPGTHRFSAKSSPFKLIVYGDPKYHEFNPNQKMYDAFVNDVMHQVSECDYMTIEHLKEIVENEIGKKFFKKDSMLLSPKPYYLEGLIDISEDVDDKSTYAISENGKYLNGFTLAMKNQHATMLYIIYKETRSTNEIKVLTTFMVSSPVVIGEGKSKSTPSIALVGTGMQPREQIGASQVHFDYKPVYCDI